MKIRIIGFTLITSVNLFGYEMIMGTESVRKISEKTEVNDKVYKYERLDADQGLEKTNSYKNLNNRK
jgi:hypothetical protein